MTIAEMRALFPSAQGSIHLNHAGAAPAARPIADAVRNLLDALTGDDSMQGYMTAFRRQGELRAGLARLLRVAPETLAFTRNTSHGLAITADSFPFVSGDNVVIPAGEYPANIYPWMAQGHRGVETRVVPAREEGIVAPEDLMNACDARTRVLSVSWVQWHTGQRLDLNALGSFCRERGIVFVVDIVQGVGALRPDLGMVDVAAAGCHKWLLTPAGMGILYIRPEILSDLLPTNIGWNSVVDPIDWERIHFDLKPGTQRFEEGSPNIMGIVAFHAAIDLLESVGFDAVEKSVLEVADYTRAALQSRGCRVISPDAPEERSGIVCFRHPTRSNEEVLAALTAKKVAASVRGGNVRFSAHAYNTEGDIDAAMAAMEG